MHKILVIGAGRSASTLIDYLLSHANELNWLVTIADMDIELAKAKANAHPKSRCIAFNVTNAQQREQEIAAADIVVSMLPAFMHADVARDCVRLSKHLATASYVSEDMRALDAEAKKKGITLLNEIGLDPGVDHASAMKIIDEIKEQKGQIISFKSYCGGLVAPESNDNPWGYKFSWNPRNVILAGQGTAMYLENGTKKFIPYNRVFCQTEKIAIENLGSFDGYANRDSLSYIQPYGIEGVQTILRGTLRAPGYCMAWHFLAKLGLTDDTYKIHNADLLTFEELVSSFLPKGSGSVEERFKSFYGNELDAASFALLQWLEIFTKRKIKIKDGSPAQILQELLEEKWKLKEKDLDMIVMQHQFEYKKEGKMHNIVSSLVVKGDDQVHTAMSKTVGLPLAIGVKFILDGTIKSRGVVIPVSKEIYIPLLKELELLGVTFSEKCSS